MIHTSLNRGNLLLLVHLLPILLRLPATDRNIRLDTGRTKTDHFLRHHFRTSLAIALAPTPRLPRKTRHLSVLGPISGHRWNFATLFRCNTRTLPLNLADNTANRLERLFSNVVLGTTNFSVHTYISKAFHESCTVWLTSNIFANRQKMLGCLQTEPRRSKSALVENFPSNLVRYTWHSSDQR